MVKKKLYGPTSTLKLAEAIMGNVAGRLGGLVGLDRDVQLELYRYGVDKANYWHSKFSLYHDLRVSVANAVQQSNPNAPSYLYGLAYAYAQKVAKLYAMYPPDVANSYLEAVRLQFSDLIGLLGTDVVNRIEELARAVGTRLYNMYRLGGQPEQAAA